MSSREGLVHRGKQDCDTLKSNNADSTMEEDGEKMKYPSPALAQGVVATNNVKIPPLLQFWRRIAAPFPYIPLFGVNMSFAIFMFFVFIVVRVLVEEILINFVGYSIGSKEIKSTAKCIVNIIHSCILVVSHWTCLRSHKFNPSEKLEKSPIFLQESMDAIMQFTVGYMAYDCINIYVRALGRGGMKRRDFSFILHHITGSVFPTTTRIAKAGHMTYMMCSLLGELTNPLKDALSITKHALSQQCCDGPMMYTANRISAVAFSVVYLPTRITIGPAILLYLTYHHWKYGRRHIRLTYMLYWQMCFWGIMVSSGPWINYSWATIKYYFQLWQLAVK